MSSVSYEQIRLLINLPPNPCKIFLYLFFELMALCKHSAKFGGEAVHFFVERFGVFRGVLYANVAAGCEDVVLFGDVFGFYYGAEAFFVLQFSVLEGGEGVGKAVDVFFGKVAVLAVYHVAQVACIYEKSFARLLFAAADESEGYGNCYAVEKLGWHGNDSFY